MRVKELNEAEIKKAVFTFGRLNPPHFGHHALIQTLQKTAQKQGCDWFLFVSSKTGDEKNPLTYEQKVWWIQALYPETKGHLIVDPSIKTPLIAATWLYNQGYRAATFVAGEDDMSSYGEMIKSGNAHGQANPNSVKSGKGFIFNPLDFAISPRLASATNARRNVTDGDPEAFVRSILGPKISPQLAELVHDQLYPTLRKAMGLGESVRESAELNKSTPSVQDLARKYATEPAEIHRQINRGVKIEFEHTNDIEVATEIAMDHLKERLDYYDILDKLEKTPKKKFGENFADGKGPGRPGDSQRHGIPKGASISQLEKASHADGRKGQLARWQLNMRRGKKRANEEITNEVADQPYRFISPVSTATTQKSMFKTDGGTTIQVFIQVDTENGVADIGFYDATDKDNPTIGMTGKGDAFRIFATVGAIVKQFVDKRKPKAISFSGKASEPGRVKLYDMIAKNIGRYLPDYKLINSGFANGDKGYMFKRVAQESVIENVELTPEDVYKKNKLEDLGISFEEFERYVERAIEHHSKLYTYWHKFKDHKKAYHLAQQEVLKNLYRNKKYYMSKPVIKTDPIDPMMSNSDWWKNKISEEKKPKKPKTIIDGALKTLIAKGRSEDEAIADLKKEIDSKFYDLDEWSPMDLAIMEGGHLLDDYDENLEETLKKVKGQWALVSRHKPEKVLQYYKGSGHPSKEWVNKVERRVHSFESTEAKIDDDWFKTGSFKTYKKATPIKYQTADKAGVLQTLEGPVKYDVGFKIITGPKGEQYPIPPEKFASLYDDNGDGTATPKKIIKLAKLADHDGVVNTSWGEPLHYTAGNDYIVRHGSNDYGAIKKDIFAQTYVKESVNEAKYDMYAGISFPDGPVYYTSHMGERIAKKDRLAPLSLIQDLLLKAKREHSAKIVSYDYDNAFVIKKKSGPGIAVLKQQQPDKSIVYKVTTYHPDKNIGLIQDRVFVSEMYVSEDEDDAKPLVYLDMDGVLADFFGEWSRLAGVDHYKDIDDTEAKLQLVRDHPTFWVDLPLLPHAKALVKTVIEKYGEYRICSTPLEGDERSKPGKIAWIKKHFADMPPVEIVLTQNKAEHAKHNGVASILVDDFGTNINKWKAAGGIGIKYEDSAFPKVATVLTSIAKSGVPK